jgi:hypothetical protein
VDGESSVDVTNKYTDQVIATVAQVGEPEGRQGCGGGGKGRVGHSRSADSQARWHPGPGGATARRAARGVCTRGGERAEGRKQPSP